MDGLLKEIAIFATFQAPLIFGNGDVETVRGGYDKAEQGCADGVMIGRAMFGNPWFFRDMERPDDVLIPTREERIKTLVRQVELFDEHLRDAKSFAVMKKFFKTYMAGFDDAPEIRRVIMEMETAGEVAGFLKSKL